VFVPRDVIDIAIDDANATRAYAMDEMRRRPRRCVVVVVVVVVVVFIII
jgi:hypothetical protein